MDVKDTQQFLRRNMILNRYHRYISTYYFLKLIVFLILFGFIIVSIKQSGCITIKKYEINIIFNETLQKENMNYKSINVSTILSKNKNFKYDIAFDNKTSQFSKIVQVSNVYL